MLRRSLALAAFGLAVLPHGAGAAEPAVATSPLPADRLAAARTTIDYIFPLGTYEKMMGATMDQLMDSVMDSVMKMPLKDLAGAGGLDAEKLDAMSSASMAEMMAIYDPAFQERMRLTTRAMMGEMTGLMSEFEPEIRDGLASAYAGKYTAQELGEMNAFFATPTGKRYAENAFLMFMDPQVMAKMQAFMPRMMKEMPAILEKAQAATADLPAPRKYADLSEAERDKLAGILGVSRKDLDAREARKPAS